MNMFNWLYKAFNYTIVKICNYGYNLLFRIQLKFNEVEYGNHVRTHGAIPTLKISRGAGIVKLGNDITFNNHHNTSWSCKCFISVSPNAKLFIGNNTGMNGVMIYCAKAITIGNYVNIGGGTRIYDTNFHSINWHDRRNTNCDKDNTRSSTVVIEDDVFIGTNCIIGKGVTIGARSVIGAGSVVTCNVPSDEIWAGNPARCIKKLIIQ